MLSAAKPKLQSDIKQILYDALYEAYLTTFDQSSITENSINNIAENEINEFGDKFAKKASEVAAEPLATAIYDFVKQIGIVATPKGTLIAPPMGGPVTGSIIMTDFTIS